MKKLKKLKYEKNRGSKEVSFQFNVGSSHKSCHPCTKHQVKSLSIISLSYSMTLRG